MQDPRIEYHASDIADHREGQYDLIVSEGSFTIGGVSWFPREIRDNHNAEFAYVKERVQHMASLLRDNNSPLIICVKGYGKILLRKKDAEEIATIQKWGGEKHDGLRGEMLPALCILTKKAAEGAPDTQVPSSSESASQSAARPSPAGAIWNQITSVDFGGRGTRNEGEEVEEFVVEKMGTQVGLTGVNVGSGLGKISEKIEDKYGCNILDIDIAEIDSGNARREKFIRADAENLPITSETQDFVLSIFLLSYTDKRKVAKEMFRVLLPGGRMVLVLHKQDSYVLKTVEEEFDTDHPPEDHIRDLMEVLNWLEYFKSRLEEGQGITMNYNKDNLHKNILDNLDMQTAIGHRWEAYADNAVAICKARLLVFLLLQHRPNMFKNEDEVREFFESEGFSLAEPVALLKTTSGEDYALGVVLDKPEGEEISNTRGAAPSLKESDKKVDRPEPDSAGAMKIPYDKYDDLTSPEYINAHLDSIHDIYMGIARKAYVGDKPRSIRICRDLIGVTQGGLVTQIEKATRGTSYEVSFHDIDDEDDIDGLVTLACREDNLNNRNVTILPRNLLTDAQIAALNKANAQVVYINLENNSAFDAYDLAPIEGLMGIGEAYLNDDELSFYRLYELLTLEEDYERISLEALKANPVLFIENLNFFLRPIICASPDDLDRINDRMELLLMAV